MTAPHVYTVAAVWVATFAWLAHYRPALRWIMREMAEWFTAAAIVAFVIALRNLIGG